MSQGRECRSNGAPRLSVVVASVSGYGLLGPTLDALDIQPERSDLEVIVVEATNETTRAALESRRPAVRIVRAVGRESIPVLRAQGVRNSTAPLVAILEDHVAVVPDWASTLIAAHEADPDVGAIGGPVENGCSGLVNWAAFLCEYARYLGPLPTHVVDGLDLPGNNIVYKREPLLRHLHELESGRWESWVNQCLREDGVPLGTSDASVRHLKPFGLGEFLSQRFHFARSFAGMRRRDQSWPRRLIYGFGAPTLPALLTWRTIREVAGRRRHLGILTVSLPLIAAFFTVGAVGEMLGYLVGPGRSLERVS